MVMQDIKLTKEKHAPASGAISMAMMQFRRYGAKRIAQYSRSRATLDATGRHHWALGKYLPRIAPADAMGINFGVKNQVVVL